MAQLLQKYADLVCSGFLNVVIEIIFRNNFCLSITKHIFPHDFSNSPEHFLKIIFILFDSLNKTFCPASPEKEDPSATAATSALYSAGPVVSDLQLF
jgi:hypothetical protein